MRALKIGPGHEAGVEMGPLVTAQHLAKVRGYIDLGVEEKDIMLDDFGG